MPSNTIFTAAAAVLSLSGMASALVGTAPYQSSNSTGTAGGRLGGAAPTDVGAGQYTAITRNSSMTMTSAAIRPGSTGTSGSGSGNSTNPDRMFCPGLDNQVFTDARGHSYVIQCGKTYEGIFIDIVISKRAVANSLNDCIAVCDEATACKATAYNKISQTCSYYSSVGAAGPDDANVDFAYVTNLDDAASTVTVAPLTNANGGVAVVPSTVYTTTVRTITSCAPTVTNCPLRNNGLYGGSAVVTDTIALYTTTCPASAVTSAVVSNAACGCTASAGTATVYSGTVVQGTTTVVPVGTAVVGYINPPATATASSTGATVTVAKPSSTSVQAFTGAAGHVEAGMGMAAVMAMAAFAL